MNGRSRFVMCGALLLLGCYRSHRLAGACEPGSWTITPIDNDDRPGPTSVAVDENDVVHATWTATVGSLDLLRDIYELRYLERSDEGSWAMTVVDSGIDLAFSSVETERDGGMHIVYVVGREPAGTELRYAHRPVDGAWTIRTLTSELVAVPPAIGVDARGAVHMSWVAVDGNVLRHAQLVPDGAWTPSTVAEIQTPPGALRFNALAVNADGPHIAYQSDGALQYARRNADGSWTSTRVDADLWSGGASPSIAALDSGEIQISYAGAENTLRHAVRSLDGRWTITTVESPRAGWNSSLALDATGGAHIGFSDFPNANIGYARRAADTSWTIEVADPAEEDEFGGFPSLAVDGLDFVHLVYWRSSGSRNELNYASRCPD